MELFDKVYNCYYQAVGQILSKAAVSPITRKGISDTVAKYCYQESACSIVPKLTTGEWAFLEPVESDCFCAKVKPHKAPLTTLQRSWLKALLADERILCFLSQEELEQAQKELSGIRPLFYTNDFHYFDQFLDGDDYGSTVYQENFRTILEALEQGIALHVAYRNRQGNSRLHEVAPYQLQYSDKDHKFRLCCLKERKGRFSINTTLNLNRIERCHLSHNKVPKEITRLRFSPIQRCSQPVLLEISGERNSLERCMLHFANYEKHTEYDEKKGVYLCSIYYDMTDETQLLVDILSFGPVVRVLGPDSFLVQIRERVRRQHELFYDRID